MRCIMSKKNLCALLISFAFGLVGSACFTTEDDGQRSESVGEEKSVGEAKQALCSPGPTCQWSGEEFCCFTGETCCGTACCIQGMKCADPETGECVPDE